MPTCQQCNECPPVEVLVPTCADPQYCSETIYSRCVIYSGPALTNLGVQNGETLNSILTKINTLLAP